VKGVVFYFILLIPFAFFMERLLIGAADVRRRIAGFAVIFFVVFAILRFVHPAFNLSSSPYIILLGFIILAMGVLVLVIVVRKFNEQIRKMKQAATGIQQADIGRLDASYAAVVLGISYLRKRKTRTTLTAITLTLLTFTVLSFTSIQSSLQTFTLNPAISFGPFKGFAVGVGFSAVHGSFRIFRGLDLGQPAPGDTAANTVDLRGGAWGFGANVGLMYQPADWVRMGVAYRSGITISADDGTADFEVGKAFSSRFPDQRFQGALSLPHVVFGGVRFWPRRDLSLELDAQWVQWSSYDTLSFELSEGLSLGPGAKQTVLSETKAWKDAIQLRVGMEWVGLDGLLAVRGGFLWDQNPVPDETIDPSLPDSERLMPCVGLGTQWHGVYVDLAYMPVFGLKRTVAASSGAPMAGTYSNVTHDFTFTVGYQWE